ncbi:MAG: HDIG domain-containing protein [Brevinematales bacterium]|nr:HDIG domain-containing protein [Brevinematales bacterium]
MRFDEPLPIRIMMGLLIGAFGVSALFLTLAYWPSSFREYQIGLASPRQVVSWYTFAYENQQAASHVKKEIEKSTPFYYRVVPGSEEENKRLVQEWLSAATNKEKRVFEAFLEQRNYTYSERVREYILENRALLAKYENRFLFVVEFLQQNFLLVKKMVPDRMEEVYLQKGKEIQRFPYDQLLLIPIEKSQMLSLIRRLFGERNGIFYEALAEILISLLQPTADLDEEARERMIASQVVQRVPREVIRKGEVIVGRGVVLTAGDIEKLQAYRKYKENLLWTRFPVVLGMMLVVFVLFIYRYHRYQEILWKKSSFFLLSLIFYVLHHALLWYSHVSFGSFFLPVFLHIPFAIVTLTLPILFQQQPVAFVLLINYSLYAVFYPLIDVVSFTNLLSLSLFALYTASQKRKTFQKRYDFFVIGMEIFLLQLLFSFFYEWFYQIHLSLSDWFVVGLFALGNSLISALVAFAILPFFENMFGIPTYFRLTELSSPSTSPLLRLLQENAPGTYLHSQRLGEMCEVAAAEIGADALLAKVGAYYHDVGKLQTPEFFIENQSGDNPHDDIKPGLSISVIKQHIKYGVELARKYRLPEEIVAFIEEHHGTTSISYFYHQALRLYGEETINPADYQYPGPKPHSLETAILMLADGVEAATRAYQQKGGETKVTIHALEDIVDDIIEQRLQSGQLDECPITFAQVRKIRDAFVEYLTAAFHKRMDYAPRREG